MATLKCNIESCENDGVLFDDGGKLYCNECAIDDMSEYPEDWTELTGFN